MGLGQFAHLRGAWRKRGRGAFNTPVHTLDIEFGVAEKKDELKFVVTAISRGCFMRKLRSIGDRVQAV